MFILNHIIASSWDIDCSSFDFNQLFKLVCLCEFITFRIVLYLLHSRILQKVYSAFLQMLDVLCIVKYATAPLFYYRRKSFVVIFLHLKLIYNVKSDSTGILYEL